MDRVQVTGLLVLDDGSTRFPNLRDPGNAAATYIRCAALMARSALAAGYHPTIVTNRADILERDFAELGVPPGVTFTQRQFVSRLDPGALHRAAHHKLDVIRDLAARPADAMALIVDLDAVFLRALGDRDLPAPGAIGAYDISEAMTAESGNRAAADIHAIAPEPIASPRWYGGELIVARSSEFRTLTTLLDMVEPRYWRRHADLYHSGDEAPVSTALNLHVARGGAICELGACGTVVRWWTAKRPFPQPRLSTLTDRAVLHLPADKEFLATQAHLPFAPDIFLARYRAHARTKLALRQVEMVLRHRALGQPRAFVARL